MTEVTMLATPKDWPSVLLPKKPAADPVDLDAAIAAGAFSALRMAIRDLGPTGTIAAIGASGLRGRGGAGYPAADKWRTASSTPAAERIVVANGYGSDPSTSTDHVLMERNPYAVIEGLAIAALAIGAGEAIIAIRATAEAAVKTMETAIAATQEAGLIGPDTFGHGRHLDMSVRTVQGAYLLGEETILLKALEGKRGQPEQRPPHPASSGLRGLPTVVHNVQTLAAIPWIVTNGSEAYAKIGARDCPGTMLVQVRGPEATGIAEVPMGTPLRTIVELVGSGARPVKAVLVGGPSGGILPPDALDVPYTFAGLRAAGAHVGSGSVIVADDRACIVDLARVLTRYCADEACGKTIPCRIGTRRLSEIGDRLAAGTSRAGDLDLLTDLAADIVESALCDHERLATLPLVSGMRYFRAELDEHLERSSCPAGVCHPIAMTASATH